MIVTSPQSAVFEAQLPEFVNQMSKLLLSGSGLCDSSVTDVGGGGMARESG
jgi:hypothetical protein